jgi:hypothetical protein
MHALKTLIRWFLIYLAGFIFFAATFICIGYWALTDERLYKVSDEKTTFIFGHSRTSYAYNDKLMKATRNFANTAEPYFFTFAKVKQVLKANPNVKIIVVELSEIHMNQQLTDMWTYDKSFLSHHLPNYAPLLTLHQHLLLAKRNPRAYLQLLPLMGRQNFGFVIRPKKSIYGTRNFGGYLIHDSSIVDKLAKRDKMPEQTAKQHALSTDLRYLDEIAKYCNKHSIELIFLRSPVHKAFKMREHDSLWNAVYTNRYRQYPVIDFTDYPLPDTAFYDYHHLNKYGAVIISPKLDSAIQRLIIKK